MSAHLSNDYSTNEMMTVAAARNLGNGSEIGRAHV